ncbi:MAG: divergent polysaccharide deacetylase family protein [Candidatus Omnitrophica bacterium]|nr:divergent polysaccharide deacetylase family protein [Candidatus Omnitrophota bacterium]
MRKRSRSSRSYKSPKKTSFVPLLVLASVIGLFIWWVNTRAVQDRVIGIEKRVVRSLSKYDIDESDLRRRFVEEEKAGARRYSRVNREYNVPASFAIKDFGSGLKKDLEGTGYSIAKSDYVIGRDTDLAFYEINYGSLDVMTLKLLKRKAPAKPPAVAKKFAGPKVAIVIDDFGYSMNNVEQFFSIKEQLTFSVLPHLKYSRRIAEAAKSKGYEVILHMPMEAKGKGSNPEKETITTSMPSSEVVAKLKAALDSVPGATGVSNHTGSKATEDKRVMTAVIRYLKGRNVYFFDSFVTSDSVCRDVSKSLGVRSARRDFFLDNSNDEAAIEKQVAAMKNFAFKKGRAIAICHDRKNTAKVLAKAMPAMADEGVRFVPLSEMVK